MTEQISNAALIAVIDQYKDKREEVKATQKEELESILLPWKYSLGRVIVQARTQRGLTVSEIGVIIGVQNRTFIYEMIRAYQAGPEGFIPVKPATPAEEQTPVEDGPPYRIEWLDDSDTAHVIFPDDEEYYVTVDNGFPDIPEEWEEHTRARRDLYKEIIVSIRAHFKNKN